ERLRELRGISDRDLVVDRVLSRAPETLEKVHGARRRPEFLREAVARPVLAHVAEVLRFSDQCFALPVADGLAQQAADRSMRPPIGGNNAPVAKLFSS